jgi:hypothetical protein
MTKTLLTTIVAMLLIAGCESSDQHNTYQPSDGRNLAPAMKDASHGDPQFPADVDRGGGGGTH